MKVMIWDEIYDRCLLLLCHLRFSFRLLWVVVHPETFNIFEAHLCLMCDILYYFALISLHLSKSSHTLHKKSNYCVTERLRKVFCFFFFITRSCITKQAQNIRNFSFKKVHLHQTKKLTLNLGFFSRVFSQSLRASCWSRRYRKRGDFSWKYSRAFSFVWKLSFEGMLGSSQQLHTLNVQESSCCMMGWFVLNCEYVVNG